MNRERVDQIVSAVLYEGYILYPYRPSSKKKTPPETVKYPPASRSSQMALLEEPKIHHRANGTAKKLRATKQKKHGYRT